MRFSEISEYLAFGIFLLLCSCRQQESTQTEIRGETMGTTYSVILNGTDGEEIKPEIDRLLYEINLAVSTYIDQSLISRLNRSTSLSYVDTGFHHHLTINVQRGLELANATDGHFDPTVMPLVRYWGFGGAERRVLPGDSLEITALMERVGWQGIRLDREGNRVTITKSHPDMALDLSASAKGYGVDCLANMLDDRAVGYMVEIGGEVRVKGRKSDGSSWRVGINRPVAGVEVQQIVEINEVSMATSGNYRNHYEIEGRNYVHTINPFTGFTELNTLLSATIITDECLVADAWATACMVMGYPRAISAVDSTPGLEGFFIYSGEGGGFEVSYTAGFERWLVD